MHKHINSSSTKTALVIGCNGAFGQAISLALIKQGWQVKGLLRDAKKRPNWLAEKNVIIGDCINMSDLTKAACNVDLLVYGANPLYHQWQQKAQAMLEPTIKIAEMENLHLLFPGNVYGYNPQKTPVINEQTPTEAVTEKGIVRIALEKRLQQAADNGATVTLIRAGDFIAQHADSSWFNHLLHKNKSNWTLSNPSPDTQHQHCYAYLPDLAANAVALLALDKQGLNVWHEAGVVATHQDWLNVFQKLNIPVKSKSLAWWQLKLVGLFNPVMREVIKMRYLWQQSLLLDGTKMQKALGEQYQQSTLADIMIALTEGK